MNRILAVAILVGVTGCSYTQPYVTNISPAGKNGILVEKCKIQMNQLTTQISDTSCNTSYVWLGGEGGKNNSEEGSNPNNNVITIKQLCDVALYCLIELLQHNNNYIVIPEL